MQVTRIQDAKPYNAARHHEVTALRLQGKEATSLSGFWAGLSTIAPGGGAEFYGSPGEKIYIVLEGEVTVITSEGEATLGPLDSCFLASDEQRAVENRATRPARMLVIASS